ncbi:hypothetical protein AVEN_121728-1 [Araneus ventricosus]|uniref:Sushi domain-containing protein n=1 Tax=Araneus ventricosus TaxID=182803 RepID=A0A4Y2X4T6_ARAVE|nr:hypothetical protein AVEN_121728-1 [Araneus ventricosus]
MISHCKIAGIRVVCPNPSVDLNGTIDYIPANYRRRRGQGFKAGKVVYFTCKSGYELAGPSNIICLRNGQWNTGPPTCRRTSRSLVLCKDPGYVQNGGVIVSYSSRTNRRSPDSEINNAKEYPVGTRLSYDCKAGYRLEGEKHLFCRPTGLWEGEKPVCAEEHVDTRPSRKARDNEDAAKLSQWLSEHNPFLKIDVIMSIDSGIVGGNEVNCHLSEEIGGDMISKMMGGKFENVKFKRKRKVVTLASINSSVKICNISIVVDLHILFHRLCIVKQSDDDLKTFFKFELSPFPNLLFTGESMRKGTKSSLYTSFSPITEDVKPEGSQYVVVDGGHLLQKIVWRQQATFGAIADRYVQYLNNKYGQDIAVIIDVYSDDDKKSTKNCERLPRAAHFSPDIMFHEETVLQYIKETLLANECNKKRFIELLKKALQKANICVQQAVEDADLTIVNSMTYGM